jgi:hypothetical protein
MKGVVHIIITFSTILLILLLTQFWFLDYSGLNIPENIPYTLIKTGGFFLICSLLTILIIAEKLILKTEQVQSIAKLTLAGTLITFAAEVAFQGIRQFTLEYDKLYHFLWGVVGLSFFGAVFSFFIAFQLKTKKTTHLIMYILIFIVISNIIIRVFPSWFVPRS